MKLSGAQKIARFFSSKARFQAMQAESETWVYTCSACGKQSNVWESGGIRYKAKGEPRVGIKCPKCGKAGVQKLSRSVAEAEE